MGATKISEIGEMLTVVRGEAMTDRRLGLTKIYNLVNSPNVTDSANTDVCQIRELHRQLDAAVMAAYGWSDIPLGHGFHTYRQVTRWTVNPAARVEILDRLLEENFRRAAEQNDSPSHTDDTEFEEVAEGDE